MVETLDSWGRSGLSAAAKTFFVALAFVALTTAPARAGTEATEAALIAELNRVRALHGAAPLRVDPALRSAARAHSSDMLRTEYFAHGDVRPRLLRFGVRAAFLGENLAWGVGTAGDPRSIVSSWLASPGHRRNLLRRGWERVGVGVAVGAFGGYEGVRMVTADFAGR